MKDLHPTEEEVQTEMMNLREWFIGRHGAQQAEQDEPRAYLRL
ncbi:MAG: hypothetical protein ABMA13_06590 [Chthoniobacteraceae bacterium]